MDLLRTVVVFDAADLATESAFWAAMLDGHVRADDDWHNVMDSRGVQRIAVQLAPDHVAPDWPDGPPKQQIHLDLHVAELGPAHERVMALGARLLQRSADVDSDSGFQVYADPAGHPFCLCWGSSS